MDAVGQKKHARKYNLKLLKFFSIDMPLPSRYGTVARYTGRRQVTTVWFVRLQRRSLCVETVTRIKFQDS